jgi:glycoside/pentoside/hexuronide:cation symporter, GPH family
MAPSASRSQGSLSLATMLAFSGTSLPIAALGFAIAVQLPAFLAANIGVELLVVAGAIALARTIDIPIEPGLGLLMDRTKSRWGRYRLWTVLGAPFLMVGLFMVFSAPYGADISYLLPWLLVMYLGISILVLSHAAWASVLAKSYDERSRLFGTMGAVGVLGAVMVLVIPIVAERLGFSDADGSRAMGWFIIGVTPLAIAVVVMRTPETLTPEVPGKRFRARDYLDLIIQPSLARILAADFCLSLGPGWMAALYIFFARDGRGFTTGEASLLLIPYVLAGLVGAPAMAWLATRISKHRATMIATTVYSVLTATLLMLPRGSVAAWAPMMFAIGFLAAGFTVLTRAMTADIADEVRLVQGKERSGLIFALTTLTTKIATAGSIILTFGILDRIGYDAKIGPANSPEAIRGLEIMYISGPIFFVLVGGACLIGYRLSAERAAEVRRQLEARDALQAEG